MDRTRTCRILRMGDGSCGLLGPGHRVSVPATRAALTAFESPNRASGRPRSPPSPHPPENLQRPAHEREHGHGADKPPAWMRKQLVCPALPARLCIAVGTRPGHGLVQQCGAVMAIGVNLVSKASRQDFRSCVARGEQISEPRGEMAAELTAAVRPRSGTRVGAGDPLHDV